LAEEREDVERKSRAKLVVGVLDVVLAGCYFLPPSPVKSCCRLLRARFENLSRATPYVAML